jgi:hypothetical protein
MSQEFDRTAGLHLDRDDQGIGRHLLHVEELYVSKAHTPQLAAREYLEKFGPMLGITAQELKKAGESTERRPIDAQVEYRFLAEKPLFDMVTVVLSQACLGLPVWEAGVAVQMRKDPLIVVSAQSTLHPDVHVEPPSKRALDRLDKLDAGGLARHLGVTEELKEFDLASLQINRSELIIYRYEASKRLQAPVPLTEPSHNGQPAEHHHHSHVHCVVEPPPLPALPKSIEDGRHYVAAAIYFVLGTREVPDLHWLAIIEIETLAVLRLRPFVDTVDGLVFRDDPITDNGGPAASAPNAALNPVRTSAVLRGVAPPIAGTVSLIGDLIQLKDAELPAVSAPTEPAGTAFDFDARTNNFAAVNAYYHTDRFFRVVHDLGFDLSTFFAGTNFPTVVDHRGSISTPTGNEINAHCLGNGSYGILRTTFMLADLTNIANPLGIACDYRVVLHELGGHGTLYNHVNSPNFGFSHSAGDSFGAVLNDPESHAPDRFMTFPWIPAVARRQDRTPGAGWGWSGAIALNPFSGLDPGGYNNEQILCTTHFRLYRALGGDSTELPVRNFAARYVAYLMLRTIASLTSATNPPNAAAWASGLMSSDFGDWTKADQIGGCYWKVIRWSFEKQGLYQPVATPKPNNLPGAAPPVDVYIDDGRGGEYQYGPANQYPYLQRFWETSDIWNRHEADGLSEHQTPVVGRKNYAYVRVKNRGLDPASGVIVRGHHCRPSAGLVWPDDFKPMATPSLSLAAAISPGSEALVGPFEWHPTHPGHEVMLMSAGAAGDQANNDPSTLFPCAAGPTPLWRMVPTDNNLGLRALIPVPGGGGRRALVAAFKRRRFWASNPFARTGKVEVRINLPSFLSTRGWTAHLDNPGGGSFTLGPRDTREMQPRLIGGQTFTAAAVTAAGQVAIEIVVLVDGLVVGGLTFVLDPKLKHPPHEVVIKHDHEEHHHHEEPKEHHHHEHEHHHHDRPRRIKFEIDLD